MKEIPADLVLESGAAINGFDKNLTRSQQIRSNEALGRCRGCHFLEQKTEVVKGEEAVVYECTIFTAKGRRHIQGIMDRQETKDKTVQSLVTRGDLPVKRISNGDGGVARYAVNCFKNFVTGTFRLPKDNTPPERSPSGTNFYGDRRNTPWVQGVRRRG